MGANYTRPVVKSVPPAMLRRKNSHNQELDEMTDALSHKASMVENPGGSLLNLLNQDINWVNWLSNSLLDAAVGRFGALHSLRVAGHVRLRFDLN